MSNPCAPGVGKPGGVYVCNDPGFSGKCLWLEPPYAWTHCHDFTPSEGIWRSIGPNYQGYCVIYVGLGCTSGKVLDLWTGDGKKVE